MPEFSADPAMMFNGKERINEDRICRHRDHGRPHGRAFDGRRARTVLKRPQSHSPVETKEFAEQINALGCGYLDAPVSGGEVGAKAGTLTIMVGGDQATFDKVEPLFRLMGQNITLVGKNGDGQTCKVANQIIVALPNTATAQELFNSVAAQGDSGLDHSAMVLALEKLAEHKVGSG
jgi:2-hydroxy-3-oxopropionate reductase